MLIKKNESREIANSMECIVNEYAFSSQYASFATAFIDGRYPIKGKVANIKCEEIYYVISGEGIVHSEFGDFPLKPGDLYHFKMGEKYYTEGKKLKLVLVNAPPWNPQQHKVIE